MSQNRVFSEIVTKESYQSTEEICNMFSVVSFFFLIWRINIWNIVIQNSQNQMSPAFTGKSMNAISPLSGCRNFCHSACQLLLRTCFYNSQCCPLAGSRSKPFFTSVVNLTISSPFKRFPNAQTNLHFNMENDLLGSWGKSRIPNSKSK